MVEIQSIVSERDYQNWPSWFVVYEWEDIIANCLGLEIISSPNKYKVIRKIRNQGWKKFHWFSKFSVKKGLLKLCFVMNSEGIGLYTFKGCIPIFLDTPVATVQSVIDATESLPCFFVTCLDFLRLLESNGCKNAHYIPLSISDRYITNIAPEKKIDVLQFGRKNNVLHDWMLRYCKEHDGVEYVYQTEDGSLTYTSTTRGNIGKFDSREEYMNLMKCAKVSLVSTPGCDKNRDFGGIDFVTPRFYESAACYCQMIGRYTENDETKQIGLNSVCPNVKSYEEFVNAIDDALARGCADLDSYKKFLNENCTSKRANEIKGVFESAL